jgi:tRNA threonylcarbamoyl adenosine modification protein (Sua5/YciO/YrdC/YwlC family)
MGCVRAGGLVVVPTDTVYGLAADAFTAGATARVFALKRRSRELPLPILVSRPRQAWALSSSVPAGAPALAEEFWPGALTMILPMASDLAWDLGDAKGSIAVRIPDHADLIALLEMAGPLAVTSANLSGEPTPPTIDGVRARLGDAVAVYVDGGPAPGELPSTIVDLTAEQPRIVREGAIDADRIRRILAST